MIMHRMQGKNQSEHKKESTGGSGVEGAVEHLIYDPAEGLVVGYLRHAQ
jgi:hypothetical protein